ncbi:hypothetical protein GF516_10865, partial [Staphylococcus aureus]|nr:hypothetical protein [Staphylococcus aureus]
MINETKYMRQQITNLIQIIDTIKYNTVLLYTSNPADDQLMLTPVGRVS